MVKFNLDSVVGEGPRADLRRVFDVTNGLRYPNVGRLASVLAGLVPNSAFRALQRTTPPGILRLIAFLKLLRQHRFELWVNKSLLLIDGPHLELGENRI